MENNETNSAVSSSTQSDTFNQPVIISNDLKPTDIDQNQQNNEASINPNTLASDLKMNNIQPTDYSKNNPSPDQIKNDLESSKIAQADTNTAIQQPILTNNPNDQSIEDLLKSASLKPEVKKYGGNKYIILGFVVLVLLLCTALIMAFASQKPVKSSATTANSLFTATTTKATPTTVGTNYTSTDSGFSIWFPSSYTTSKLPTTVVAGSSVSANGSVWTSGTQTSGNYYILTILNLPSDSKLSISLPDLVTAEVQKFAAGGTLGTPLNTVISVGNHQGYQTVNTLSVDKVPLYTKTIAVQSGSKLYIVQSINLNSTNSDTSKYFSSFKINN